MHFLFTWHNKNIGLSWMFMVDEVQSGWEGLRSGERQDGEAVTWVTIRLLPPFPLCCWVRDHLKIHQCQENFSLSNQIFYSPFVRSLFPLWFSKAAVEHLCHQAVTLPSLLLFTTFPALSCPKQLGAKEIQNTHMTEIHLKEMELVLGGSHGKECN